MIMFFVFSYIINFCINLLELFLELMRGSSLLMKNFNLLTYTDIAAATIEYRIIYFLEYLIPFNSLKGQGKPWGKGGYFNSPCVV